MRNKSQVAAILEQSDRLQQTKIEGYVQQGDAETMAKRREYLGGIQARPRRDQTVINELSIEDVSLLHTAATTAGMVIII